MNPYAATCQEALALVWTRRHQLTAEYGWSNPPRLDAIRFAITEYTETHEVITGALLALALEQPHLTAREALDAAGRALDGYLRGKPEYIRNHARRRAILDEAADCAMMLLSSLPEQHRFDPERPPATIAGHANADGALDFLIDTISQACMMARYGNREYALRIEESLHLICQLPEIDLVARLEQRLLRIEAKLRSLPAPGA